MKITWAGQICGSAARSLSFNKCQNDLSKYVYWMLVRQDVNGDGGQVLTWFLSNNKSWTGAWQSKLKMHSFERRLQTDIPLDVPQAWRCCEWELKKYITNRI